MSANTGTFRVHVYTPENLQALLTGGKNTDKETVTDGKHLVYFKEYFGAMGAAAIIEEQPYVDKDYLEDYASYYVKCFEKYDRWCTRLHFFAQGFSGEDFSKYLEGEDSTITRETLQENYLGFIVLKPLPVTVVGRTCLKSYPGDGVREFPATRRYRVNLAGTCFSVRSLAFQQQDSVVAACATSALWSAFHNTGKMFQHAIPTPVEITKQATELEPLEARSIPNHGLNGKQMARAIRNVGLEPNLERAMDAYMLATAAYAYLRAGIPSILAFRLYHEKAGADPELFGMHAVAVTPPCQYACDSLKAENFRAG